MKYQSNCRKINDNKMRMKKEIIIWLCKHPCSCINDMKIMKYEYVKSLTQDKEKTCG